jgi:hypothetical protein
MKRIYADFALPAAKFFYHQGTKTQSPLNRKCFLDGFVPSWLFYHRAEGVIKIRVNPLYPRHPRCYCCRFSKSVRWSSCGTDLINDLGL